LYHPKETNKRRKNQPICDFQYATFNMRLTPSFIECHCNRIYGSYSVVTAQAPAQYLLECTSAHCFGVSLLTKRKRFVAAPLQWKTTTFTAERVCIESFPHITNNKIYCVATTGMNCFQ
jgi:hypothetical protein